MNNILIVDDEPEIRRMIGMIADSCAVTHDQAENGFVAVEMVQAAVKAGKPYRLVLLDINMPRMTGDEACVAIHQIDQSIPIVIVSAQSESIVRDLNLVEFGVRAFIDKPFNIEDISALLQQFASPDPRLSDRRVFKRHTNAEKALGVYLPGAAAEARAEREAHQDAQSNESSRDPDVELLDVSATGIRFASDRPIKQGERLKVNIRFDLDDMNINRDVSVVWQENKCEKTGRYITGAKFEDAEHPRLTDVYLTGHLDDKNAAN